MADRSEHLATDDYLNGMRSFDQSMLPSTPAEIVRRTFDGYGHGAVKINLGRIADILNPYDRTLEKSMFHVPDMRRAVGLGGTAGILLARESYKPEQVTVADIIRHPIRIDVPPEYDEIDQTHEAARILIERGEQGLTRIGREVTDWLEAQEDELVPKAYLRRYYRIGAGIMVISAESSFAERLARRHALALNKFERELNAPSQQPIDWDQALRNLTG